MSGPGAKKGAILRLALIALLAAAVPGGYSAPGLAWEVEAKRFMDALDRAPRVSVLSAEAISEIERASVEIAARVDRLRSARKIRAAQQTRRQWIEGLDRELAQAVEAAERERRIQEQIGTWALFFQIVSDVYTVVETAMEADAGADGEMLSSDDGPPASLGQPEDGLQGLGGEHNGVVIVCGDGKCETFRASDLIDAALNPLSSSGSSQIRELDDKLRDTADELPPLGCWLDSETCFPFSNPSGEIPSAIDGVEGSKQGNFQTKANSLISKEAKSLYSLLLDFAGPVGRGKGILEAAAGEDPVTGESFTIFERIVIGASSAYGGGPGKKGAKKLLKFGAKGGKQGKKFPKITELDVRKIEKILNKRNWYEVRTKGGHKQFKHKYNKDWGTITVPTHHKQVSKEVLSSINKKATLK